MTLQQKIIKYFKARPDTWVIKVEVANERGCPDILACVHGRFVAIEIKESKDDKLSPIQNAQRLSIIFDGKGRYYMVRNYDKWLEEFEKRYGVA